MVESIAWRLRGTLRELAEEVDFERVFLGCVLVDGAEMGLEEEVLDTTDETVCGVECCLDCFEDRLDPAFLLLQHHDFCEETRDLLHQLFVSLLFLGLLLLVL